MQSERRSQLDFNTPLQPAACATVSGPAIVTTATINPSIMFLITATLNSPSLQVPDFTLCTPLSVKSEKG